MNKDEPLSLLEPTRGTAKKERSAGLDILRIISICGVVAIHVFGLSVGLAPRGSTTWWISTAIDIGSIWVVPVFVMISGALLLGSAKLRDAPARFYRSRAARLIPALIAWNLIYLIGVRIWLRGEPIDLSRTLQLLTDGSVFTQLYFLWLILGLYAVAPLIAAFLQVGSRYRALITGVVILGFTVLAYMVPGVLSLLGISRPINLNFLTQWIPYVGYFILGYGLRNVRLTGIRLAGAVLASGALGVFIVWEYAHKADYPILAAVSSVSYLGIAVALLAIGVFVVVLSWCENLRPGNRLTILLRTLSEASFGVFLIHLVIFELIRLNIPQVAAGTSLSFIALAYLVTLVVSFVISVVASRIPLLRTIF